MFTCPHCRTTLVHEETSPGFFWRCAACEGRLFTIGVLRKQLTADYVNRLWRGALEQGVETATACPGCGRGMREVAVPSVQGGGGPLRIDVCTGCHVVWFDVHEMDCARTEAPLPSIPEPDLPPRAQEILAMARIEDRRREYESADLVLGGPPMDFWSAVVTLFGLPVEADRSPFRDVPFVTLSVAAALFGGTLLAWYVDPGSLDVFGFLPSDPWRHHGLTWLTSFFLHDSLLHLFGNVVFLVVFGPKLEERLGRANFVWLLALSALVGNVCHWLWDPNSTVALVGASGGVAGVMTLYALLFPRTILVTSLRVVVFFYWFRFRAIWGYALWVGLQLLLIWRQLHGDGHVSGLSHAGGIAVGAAWWCCEGGRISGCSRH